MRKVVLNRCYGGFGLSDIAKEVIASRKGITLEEVSSLFDYTEDNRDDAVLVDVLEQYGNDVVAGGCAKLEIEEYDEENFTYGISEYDGFESLELIPVVSEKKIAACNSTKEIMDYLESLGIEVSRQ